MGKSKRPNYFKTKTLVSNLRDMTNALPSESEKQEIQANFGALIEFLSTLQKNIASLPSLEEISGVNHALDKLQDFFARAQTNPMIAGAVGIKPSTKVRKKTSDITEEQRVKAKATLSTLQTLPVDEIRSELQKEDHSVAELYAIASELGVRSTKGISRDALAHQISMKIANYRGYQKLSGGE